MNKLVQLLIIFLSTYITICNPQVGVKIAVKQDAILKFERKFLPLIIRELDQVVIPDQYVEVDVGIGKLKINLNKIHVKMTNLTPENISIALKEPNKVQVTARNIQGG